MNKYSTNAFFIVTSRIPKTVSCVMDGSVIREVSIHLINERYKVCYSPSTSNLEVKKISLFL